MLHPDTARIAKELTGYTPFTEEEGDKQFQAPVTYFPGKSTRPAKSGDVKHADDGTLVMYYYPSEEHPEHCPDENGLSYAYQSEGFYEIPSFEDIEEWMLGETCFTPDESEVEADHPDSWLRLLGLI
jgi:hypothetical protein